LFLRVLHCKTLVNLFHISFVRLQDAALARMTAESDIDICIYIYVAAPLSISSVAALLQPVAALLQLVGLLACEPSFSGRQNCAHSVGQQRANLRVVSPSRAASQSCCPIAFPLPPFASKLISCNLYGASVRPTH